MPDAFLLKTKADAYRWFLEEAGRKGTEVSGNPIIRPKDIRFPTKQAFDAEAWPTDVPIHPDSWGKVCSLITGNSKLACPCFSLPSIDTCPGSDGSLLITASKAIPGSKKSERFPEGRFSPGRIGICTGCYARKNLFIKGRVPSAMSLRYQFTERTKDFADTMIEALRLHPSEDPKTGKRRPATYGLRKGRSGTLNKRYFRIHASGDFYSTEYIRAWIDIVDASPFVLFWAPTRVWSLGRFMNDLRTLAGRFNVTIRPSAMAFDDMPPRIQGLHAGSTAHFDPGLITRGASSILRKYNGSIDPSIRERLNKNNVFVCPAIAEETCTQSVSPQGTMPCRMCWHDKDRPVSYPAH